MTPIPLSPRQETALILACFCGLQNKEIAVRMQCSERAVMSLIEQARRKAGVRGSERALVSWWWRNSLEKAEEIHKT